MDLQGVPWRSKVDFFNDLGYHLEGLGRRCLTIIVLWTVRFPYMLSEWFLGVVLVGLWVSRATLDREKQGKFIVL